MNILLVTILLGYSSFAASQTAAEVAYTPILAPCPSGTELIRLTGAQNQSLSSSEAAYISTRHRTVIPKAWVSYLENVQQSTNQSLPVYVHDIFCGNYGYDVAPKLGISVSGGGYRAAVFGAGVLNALDGRNISSIRAGTGGLLQATSYISGLSGGSWLVGSLAQADFPTIPGLIFGNPNASTHEFGGWIAEVDLLAPTADNETNIAYLEEIIQEPSGKYAAGFQVSRADDLSRLYARHFVNGTNVNNFFNNSLLHGAGITFSAIADVPSFNAYEQPFPILVADSFSPNGNMSTMLDWTGVAVPLTNPIYEFNVFEMGSFDPMLSAFTPTKYLGSSNDSTCVTNFDQVSFIVSTSSMEGAVAYVQQTELSERAIDTTEQRIRATTDSPAELPPNPNVNTSLALFPNPFYGAAANSFIDTNETVLQLVDGSLDGENIPIQPFLVKARGVDVILAVDAGDQAHEGEIDDNFADGSALIATQLRVSQPLLRSHYSFPPVPTSHTMFLSQNLTKRPTFFGCNTDPSAPLVIYLANGAAPLGQSPVTNISAGQTSISTEQMNAMLAQTFDIATQGIAVETQSHGETVWQKDPEWPACLACAVADRARRRINEERSGVRAQHRS
ncbi:Lysophospholipase 2 [Grifola frondosa]|uniref:Lysophospholipase n=1 Tax=Grifola frondosa TaxID=5627 RepID=A0A1C7MJ80_GRIFR|nr:Lysophospholipase 2 [Grifola frondosa]